MSFKECKEYGRFIYHENNFTNSHGQMVFKRYADCGHVVHELYHENLVSTLWSVLLII